MSALSEDADATAALNIDAMLASYGGGSDIADVTTRVDELALGTAAEPHEQQAETANTTRATAALVIETAGESMRKDVLQSPDIEGEDCDTMIRVAFVDDGSVSPLREQMLPAPLWRFWVRM